MIVGIPKEIKNNEYRVSLTPAGAMELVRRGHTVYIQSGAGVDSGFADKEYQAVGAKLLPTIEEVYATAEMIIKVKEPIAPEYGLVRPGQLLFTYFHFASSEALTRAMIASGAVCCAYETVERSDRSLPLLIPMSEVAGRMAAQEGRYFLEKPRGGKGVLLGGVPGVKPAKVFVIGAGVVGTAAARTAAGTGADVTICDVSLRRLTYLADVMPRNVKTLMSSEYNIREELKHADLVVGSVLIPGAKAPKLVTRDMLKLMEPGTVMVDVAIDQGGCFETSRPTTHEDPVYYVDGILHYCVANIPGAVPRTSTLALTNATLPYTIQLADKGWRRAAQENPELALGLNIVVGFAGLLDLGYIAFYAVGAYVWALLASPHFNLHLPFWVILPVGIALAAMAGIALGFPVLKLRGDYLAIVTLGFGEIIRIFMNNLDAPVNITNGPQGINRIDTIKIGEWALGRPETILGFRITGPEKYYYVLMALVLLIIFICIRLQNSRVGRAWEAVREDEIAAKAMGINTRTIKLMAFGMGASFGGAAGCLFASMQGFVSPESFGLSESIAILCMVVLGGMGHVPGVVAGALLLSIFPEVLRNVVVPIQQTLFGEVLVDPDAIRMLLFGVALVAVMIFRPEGLWPSQVRKREVKSVKEQQA